MILVDTSVIVAWLDRTHPDHGLCLRALVRCLGEDRCAVSSVSYAELAAGGRTVEAVDEDLRAFERTDLDFAAAWRAGVAFARVPGGRRQAVLPDFLIRAQAAVRGWRHLTHDYRRRQWFPEVEWLLARDLGQERRR